MLAATIVMAVGTCAAAIVAVVAIRVARSANNQAERSADAAERSAVEAKRSADAAQRSAQASEETAALEHARRHDELKPKLRLTHLDEESPVSDLVRLENQGPLVYDIERVVLLDREIGPADGIGTPGNNGWSEQLTPDPAALDLGGRIDFSLHRRSAEDGGEVRVRAECRNQVDQWSVVVAVDLRDVPTVTEVEW